MGTADEQIGAIGIQFLIVEYAFEIIIHEFGIELQGPPFYFFGLPVYVYREADVALPADIAGPADEEVPGLLDGFLYDIFCIAVLECCGNDVLIGMGKFEVLREGGCEVGVSCKISKFIQRVYEGVKVLVVGSLYPSAIREAELVITGAVEFIGKIKCREEVGIAELK